MFLSKRRSLFLTLSVLVLAGIAFAPPTVFAYKKVVIEFEPGWCPPGVNSNAVKSQIIAGVNGYYSWAGTLFSLATVGTDFHKKLIVKDEAGSAGWEPRCVSTGYVYGGTYKTAFANSSNFLNSTAVGRAIGIAAAHEEHIAHPGATTIVVVTDFGQCVRPDQSPGE